MDTKTRLFGICAALLLLHPALLLADHDDDDPLVAVGATLGYQVSFYNNDPYNCSNPPTADDNRNFVPSDVAQKMAFAIDNDGPILPGNPPGYHVGYTNLGFKAPVFDGEEPPDDGPQVFVYDCGPGGAHDDPDDEFDDCDNGSAPADSIEMPSVVYCNATERVIRTVMGHELFHHVQDAYYESDNWLDWGRTAVEGSARMMEDMVFTDIDGDPMMNYTQQANNYLSDPNRDWWLSKYDAALGWKHMTERYGVTSAEPQLGVDFMRRFWENVEVATDNDAVDFPATLAKTVSDASAGTSLKEWFYDFSLTNIAREFDMSLIPNGDSYRYKDESDGTGITYRNVNRVWTGSIPGFNLGTTELARWGAAYAEVNIESSCQSERFISGWRSDGDYKAYMVLAIDESGAVRQLVQGAGEKNSVSFIQRGGDEAYDKLIAVLIGRDDRAIVEWQFDCGLGGLQVRRPNAEYKAYVGPNEAPGTFIIRMLVSGPTSLGAPTVLGLQPRDFEVYVGNNFVFQDEAQVVTGLYAQGEYWLVVRAPDKPNTNTYDLHVNFGSIGQMVPNAVSYEERIYDQMLTIDTSGSMSEPLASPSIDAAINAASLFADVARPEDSMGLVSFAGDNTEPNDDAIVQVNMGQVSDSQRDTILNRLAGLAPGGYTSIGDGLDKSVFNILANGSAIGENWIVLLSDGMENEALNWANVESTVKQWGMRVSTIALGPDADQVLLQDIAQETNGDYYYVDTGTLRRAAGASSVVNRLADIYAVSSERIKNHERLWEADGSVSAGETDSHVIDVSEGGIQEAVLSVNWDDAASNAEVTVKRPDGSDVLDGQNGARIYKFDTHTSVHVGALTEGEWVLEVRGSEGTADYVSMLAGRDTQGATSRLFFPQYIDDPFAQDQGANYLRGLEQPIRALLFDSYESQGGIIKDATVFAEVEHPDGTLINLPLFDDGEHDDGFAGDGIYGNVYARTTIASETDLPDVLGVGVRGSYNVVLRASGKDNAGRQFNRIRKGSFNIYESFDPWPDTDFDEMPDLYENLHPCLDAFDDEAEFDADEDRVKNIDEWQQGLDPCNPDTDLGGESDFSELARGANPFDPADDALPRPRDVEVIDWRLEHLDYPAGQPLPKANWIRYPVNEAYNQMHLWRSTSPTGPFTEVAVFDARLQGGQYYDMDLVNGTTYYYKVQPDNLNGDLGAPSHVFSGTPKADPVAPVGSVHINNGAAATTSASVTLTLIANPDVTEMRIGNDTMVASLWQPYNASMLWALSPDPQTGIATVVAQFRDAALNETTVYHATIDVMTAADVSQIRGFAFLEGAVHSDLVFASIDGQSGVSPAFTNNAGKFSLYGMPPGTYDISLSRRGYQTAVIENIPVQQGQTVQLEAVVLDAIDADSDGILDVDDNCTLIENADQRDTNADGYGNVCDPDLDNNGATNFVDLAMLKAVFFSAGDVDEDLNGDGLVNFEDLGIMKLMFFSPPGPAGELP